MAKRLQLRESLRTQKQGAIGGTALRSEKHRANTQCPKCDLVFQGGAWKHGAGGARPENWRLCPACTQIRDGQMGGVVQFSGAFAESHRQDLLNRIRNIERLTQEERPLERIINLKEGKEGITVSATTEHLAARIGKAIHRDFGGELDLRYAPDDKFAFGRWRRD